MARHLGTGRRMPYESVHHGIDLLRWMFGNEVDEVYGATRQQFHDYLEAEDIGMAVVKFRNSAVATIQVQQNVYPKNLEETLYIFGEKGTVKIGGTSTTAISPTFGISPTRAMPTRAEGTQRSYQATSTATDIQAFFADVIDAINNDRQPYVDAVAGRNALEMIFAIYKSQENRRACKSSPLKDFASIDMSGIINNG